MVIQDKNLYNLKSYPRRYKKRLRRINKTRERANTAKYIDIVLNEINCSDLYLSEFLTDACGHEYHMFEHNDWLEYLGRNWTLEDELDYSDKVYKDWQPEEDYKFTEEEITNAVNSWNKANDKTELDVVKIAMNALQGIRDWQDSWKKHGIIGTVKLYFNLSNNKDK